MADTLIYFLKQTLLIVIDVLQFAMLARAILSWFDQTGESRISGFLYYLTEPVIAPIRALCTRMHWFEGFPLDIPFLITVLVLAVMQTLLSVF